MIERRGDALFAMSPKPIAGLLEIRGQGIVAVDHVHEARLTLVVRLMPTAEIERLPDATTASLAGIVLREIRIDPGKATAAARIRAALTAPPCGDVRQIRHDVA